jgi:hypothetical protein
MSDGDTPDEALKNVEQAAKDWLEIAIASGRPVPEVGSAARSAKHRETALLSTIRTLTQAFDGLDDRLDRLASEIETIKVLYEDVLAWGAIPQLGAAAARESSGKLYC